MVTGLTKLSFLLYYRTLFPPSLNPRFLMASRILAAYVVSYTVASMIATIVQCSPISYAWDRNQAGTCINLTAFWFTNAGASILGDLCIVALPVPLVLSLQIPKKSMKMVGIFLVFSVGLLSVELFRPIVHTNKLT